MRILVLDDMQERHDGFAKIFKGHDVAHCLTYSQALFAARYVVGIELMCLDHDLADGFDAMEKADWYEGGGMYCGNRTDYNGQDFCWWLHDYPQFCAPRILIHSWNDTGAKAMEAILRSIPKPIEIVRKPYRAPEAA